MTKMFLQQVMQAMAALRNGELTEDNGEVEVMLHVSGTGENFCRQCKY